MVITDKINRYIVMKADEYLLEIEETLAKLFNVIDIKNMKRFKDEAIDLLEGLYLENIQNEYNSALQ